MKMRSIPLVLLMLFYACSCTLNRKTETVLTVESDQKKETYFVPIPFTKFSSIQSPCVQVNIDGKTFSVELDLGYRGDLTFTKETIDLISSKSFICEKPMYGIRGKEYPTSLYRIPKAKIGAMTFFKPILQEERPELVKDSVFVKNGGEPSPREPGRLGWELFYNVNLLVDVKNSQIAFCDSLDTLEKQGYQVESFTKTPLLLERGLVEFQAQTSEGLLLCMLDTGATWNMLNSEIQNGKSIEDEMWKSENIIEYTSFKIDKNEFGPIAFHRMPIKIPIRIEAILGMEFFQEHQVFLDFAGKWAYFLKASKTQEP